MSDVLSRWPEGTKKVTRDLPLVPREVPSSAASLLRNRWTLSQGTSGPAGRSGALSVSLRAALKVRGRSLNEVETWAVLCQTVQSIQDRLLQLQGKHSVSSLELLLVSLDTLRFTGEGKAEIERTRGNELGTLLHPEVSGLGRMGPGDLERLSVYSLGCTMRQASSRTIRSLQPLIRRMTSDRLLGVPGLLGVMGEVERHWREEVGSSPASQLVAQLCHLTLGRVSHPTSTISHPTLPHKTCSGSQISSVHLNRPNLAPRRPTQFSKLNSSSSSDSTDDIVSTSTCSLPKPPQNLPVSGGGMKSCLTSPLRSSLPSLLEATGDSSNRRFQQQRQYGKRLEFRPSVAHKLDRRVKDEKGQNSVRTRSHSVSSLPGSRLNTRTEIETCSRVGTIRSQQSQRHLLNARRLYKVDSDHVIGPEFVVKSSLPCLRASMISGSSLGSTVLIVLLTGHRLEVRLEPSNTCIHQLQSAALSHLGLPQTTPHLGLMMNHKGEWLYLAPELRLAKLVSGRGKDGVTSLTLHHRFHQLPSILDELPCSSSRHLLYLQIRQDTIEGQHRADVSLHLSLASLALRAEFGRWEEPVHGAGPYFLPQHYLPDQVRTLLGERGSRLALEKLHQGHVEGEENAEASYCHQLMRLKDYGFLFYSGRKAKKLDSRSIFFAIHTNGIFFFEISRNVFKPPKEIEKYSWGEIREILCGHSKIQFTLQQDSNNGKRIKIYLEENKSKHVFDMAEVYHKYHLGKMQTFATDSSPSKRSKNEVINDVFKTFCKKVKRYTRESNTSQRISTRTRLSLPLAGRTNLKRSNSIAQSTKDSARYPIRRLTHYNSMANTAEAESKSKDDQSPVHQRLPMKDKPYRYKLYLENEDDECGAMMETSSVEEGEEKENLNPGSSLASGRRMSSVRMGTRILTRDRNPDCILPPAFPQNSVSKESVPLLPGLIDVSLRPPMWGLPVSGIQDQAMDESLSISLLERFDQMETEAGEPERRIVSVVMEKDFSGRLGVKIGGTPSGIYVDKIDWGVARVISGSLKEGDRVIAVDQQSLESLGYSAVLDLMRAAGTRLELLVSQLR